SLAGLPGRIWSVHDDLQPLQPLVRPAALEPHPGCSRCQGRACAVCVDRLQLREGPPLRPWRKRGAKAQAIGPSRGGQTTKIHAVTDLLGRPAILLLTAGNVADVTMAGPLMDAAGRVRCLIADKG